MNELLNILQISWKIKSSSNLTIKEKTLSIFWCITFLILFLTYEIILRFSHILSRTKYSLHLFTIILFNIILVRSKFDYMIYAS